MCIRDSIAALDRIQADEPQVGAAVALEGDFHRAGGFPDTQDIGIVVRAPDAEAIPQRNDVQNLPIDTDRDCVPAKEQLGLGGDIDVGPPVDIDGIEDVYKRQVLKLSRRMTGKRRSFPRRSKAPYIISNPLQNKAET